ncbi:Ankyrin repeats (3 copies) [Bremerella volcania]|uniref:Ankyrin repeats (3 copies) n=1 Tax=Bremerella volcania TaxID=2527984 RepID=A0A518CCF3_9BACT|nr:ankyrin repeat domain-containing protein [Bremerella volcania]QDU76903.1 Ankyrin repeats (3 copies) [Bremerella volcania]
MSQLKKAIVAGDVERARQLLNENPKLASTPIRWGSILNSCQTEPLHFLSDGPFNQLWDHGRQAELAQILIDAGAPVDGLPGAGETPLHGAASLGEAGVAEVLIDAGANMEAVASYPGIPDGTPLDFAVHFGMVEVVDLLVREGAKILSTRIAAGAGQLDRVRADLESASFSDEQVFDVLRCAAVCDRVPLVEYLLDSGLDVNVTDGKATALHWAAWEAKPNMVSFLLNRGADATILDAKHHMSASGWAQHRRKEVGSRWGHDEVLAVLSRRTPDLR